MRFYNATFFCESGQGPKVTVDAEKLQKDEEGWPITIRINPEGTRIGDPSITIFLRNKSDLLTFKHTVISAISKVVEVIDA